MGVDFIGYGHDRHFYKWLGTGLHRESKNNKQETDQTVLTITKARTERLIVLLEPKKWRGTTKKIFTALCARLVPPLSNSYRRHCLQASLIPKLSRG